MSVDLLERGLSADVAEARAVPLVRFWQVVEGGRAPRRADRSVGGTLPVRALRYCEPVATASALGWHVFLARRFRLLWDGSEVFWQSEGMSEFEPLRSVHYPGFAEQFDQAAPEAARGFAPPFLSSSIQPGIVQVWPGSLARTRPGWSALVRPVANLARPSGYELFEGVINCDAWFGPLFTNLRLTRTGVPVEFDDDVPFMQVQVLDQSSLDDRFHADHRVEEGIGALAEGDWQRYIRTVVEPCSDPNRRHGRHAAELRKASAARASASEPGQGAAGSTPPPRDGGGGTS